MTDDILLAEGRDYARLHLREYGCIESGEHSDVFALHSGDDWQSAQRELRAIWGAPDHIGPRMWQTLKLLKTTAMKDGRKNLVFQIVWC